MGWVDHELWRIKAIMKPHEPTTTKVIRLDDTSFYKALVLMIPSFINLF